MGFDGVHFIACAESKIFLRPIYGDGIGELAGVHLVSGIPDGFEFAESLDQLRTKHFVQQCGAGLAVSVFAGERTAVGDHDVGSFVDELEDIWRCRLQFPDQN